MKKVIALAIASLFVVSTLHATLVREQFTNNPALDGWQVYGDSSLFQWDTTSHMLDVTWDSTQANSYYYHPLDRAYTSGDGFYVRFDLQLTNAVAFNGGSQLAVGLLHYADATGPDFSRADFVSPNLCEFDYFPQFSYSGTTYPDSVEATLIDGSGLNLFFTEDNLTLLPGITYRVEFTHLPGAESIQCDVSTNGQIVSTLPISATYGTMGDFQLDTLAVMNYSDDGYGDSILANGSVGNLAFASPLPLGTIQNTSLGQVQLSSDTNWVYTLQQSADLLNWCPAAPALSGNGTNLLLQATNPPAVQAFYRVSASLP